MAASNLTSNEEINRILESSPQFRDVNSAVELQPNNFLFAIHFMSAHYGFEENLEDLIKRLVGFFDVLVEDPRNNKLVFETTTHKAGRYMKKFISMNHFRGCKTDILLAFETLFEYLVDYNQPRQLWQFFPALCSAALKANIHLYLCHNKIISEKRYENQLGKYTSDKSAPGNEPVRVFEIYNKRVALERKTKESDSKEFKLFIYDDFKTLKYFALFPDVVQADALKEQLSNQWNAYSQQDRVDRYILVSTADDIYSFMSRDDTHNKYFFNNYYNMQYLRQIEASIRIYDIKQNDKLNLIQNRLFKDDTRCIQIPINEFTFIPNEENAAMIDYLNKMILVMKIDERTSFIDKQFQSDPPHQKTIGYLIMNSVARQKNEVNHKALANLFRIHNLADTYNLFSSREKYQSYKDGYLQFKSIIDSDSDAFTQLFETLIAIASINCMYAIINVLILPKELTKAALFVIPPIHVAPFEYVSHLYFVVYFDRENNFNGYRLVWLKDERDDNNRIIRFGEAFVRIISQTSDSVTYATMQDFIDSHVKAYSPNIHLPPKKDFLRSGDEYDIRKLFGKELSDKIRKMEEEDRGKAPPECVEHKAILKEEYIARITMDYNAVSK